MADRYDLILAGYTQDLIPRVNDAIKKGAVPLGSPIHDGVYFYQAVIYPNNERLSILETGPM